MIDKSNTFKVSLLIPTFNAGGKWEEALKRISNQVFSFHQKIIVDSGSTDNTRELARNYGFEVIEIPQSQFNHGATRQLLVEKSTGADIALFLTQDAILADHSSITNLIMAFNDPTVALAYGRQLPHRNALPLEKHSRLYNYPGCSHIRSLNDKELYGFKTIFCSNSFAAYRISALQEVGGFPLKSIMGEDTIAAARLLVNNYKVAYVADAMVRHSHNYTFKEEFKRFFDTRVFHEQNTWLIHRFGKPTGEGKKYVWSELKYIMRYHPLHLFKSVSSISGKWLGYQVGGYYTKITRNILKKISMHSSYWQ